MHPAGRSGKISRRAKAICALLALPVVLTACNTATTPERAAIQCEERAIRAAGPTGSATVGINSSSGAFSELSVGVTGDFIAGRDPVAVYQSCYTRLTGAADAPVPASVARLAR